jgi:hypothetical protein
MIDITMIAFLASVGSFFLGRDGRETLNKVVLRCGSPRFGRCAVLLCSEGVLFASLNA